MMQFKIDTKEKFSVLTIEEQFINDNMAADFAAACNEVLSSSVKNLIVNFKKVIGIDNAVAKNITNLQQNFYEQNASFVICELQPVIEKYFDELALLELLNTTLTESEAWDIVQMEEIERELLDSDDMEFDVIPET
jgi:anti-anti-sigma regulatory factor